MGSQSVNVGDHLLRTGAAGDIAIIDRDGAHTYTTLREATYALTHQIGAWGLRPGSRVGLLSRNSLFWVAAYLAVLRAGHIVVPFPVSSTPEDVLHKCRFVACDSMLIDSGLDRTHAAVREALPHVADQTAIQDAPRDGTHPLAVAPVEPDDDAALMFTSGTTSAPRAVRITHRNIHANTESIVDYLSLTARDRMLVVLPFSYCYGASLLHTHLMVGASLSICDTFTFPETAVEAIRRDQCTGFAGVPSHYQLLLRASSFPREPLPSLRMMQQAGGRLPQLQATAVTVAQPQAELFVMYGATEATARMSYLPPHLLDKIPGSIGRGIPGVTLSVVDDEGKEVPAGTVGELFARGENIAKGYWGAPTEEAEKFVDGGLRTGDLARADENGFIYVVDRKADFIKSWGVRVSTREIEDVLLALPGVTAAAVVGRPDEQAGEAIVAYYTTADDVAVDAQQVLAHCRNTLARPLVPHEAHQISQLPLNANGKIIKAELSTMVVKT